MTCPAFAGDASLNKKSIFLFLGALLILQAFFISCYLPFNEWLSPSLIYTDDFLLHYSDVLDKNFLIQHYGATWGYNPFQRAGSISDVIVGIDNNGWALWSFLLSFASVAVALKLYFILLVLAIPLLVYGAARNFELQQGESLACTALGTLFLHTSICVDFIYWGSVSYIASAYLSLYISSLAYRFLKTGQWRPLVLQTVVLAAALWIHIFTVLQCVPFIMVLCCAGLRSLPRQRLFLCVASLLAAAALTAPWLVPFVKMLDSSHINPMWTAYITADFFEWVNTYVFGKLIFNSYWVPFKKSVMIDIGLMLFGIGGLLTWKRDGAGWRASAFGGTILYLFLLAYYGSFIEFTRSLTPMRFIIMLNLMLLVPASAALWRLYQRLAGYHRALRRLVLPACAALVLVLVGARPYYHAFVMKDLAFSTRMEPELAQLVDYIKKNTTNQARILIENSDWESGHQYGGGHFPSILPHLTGREFIGNDFAYNPTTDSIVSFVCGVLFQKRIETLGLQDVAHLCDLYNMGWVICWSKEAKAFFSTYPDYFISDGTIGKFSLYRVNRKPSFFIRGSGVARSEMNRIELTDIVPQDGEVIVAFHWMKYLKTAPPVPMERAIVSEDPVGFIRLKNPPRTVLIYNNYK